MEKYTQSVRFKKISLLSKTSVKQSKILASTYRR